ncbi:hypothetical protein EAH_00018380 [Eimeria acervulina]|uniref:Secreted protein n=1 Tax=Eimeria acervulina TaxID=5801 RepID=U6GAN0_EIMAC|nr:hypothetical protein EAH_00018380 [Eimeria acervulina]CDI76557.1 hypothetical protein EAH_00018380 [Eimeria acervulina]
MLRMRCIRLLFVCLAGCFVVVRAAEEAPSEDPGSPGDRLPGDRSTGGDPKTPQEEVAAILRDAYSRGREGGNAAL